MARKLVAWRGTVVVLETPPARLVIGLAAHRAVQDAVGDNHEEAVMEAARESRLCIAPSQDNSGGVCFSPIPRPRRRYCSDDCNAAARAQRRKSPEARALNRKHQRTFRLRHPERRAAVREVQRLYEFLKKARPSIRDTYLVKLGKRPLASTLYQDNPEEFWRVLIRPEVLDGRVSLSAGLSKKEKSRLWTVLHFIMGVAARRYLQRGPMKGGAETPRLR